MNKLLTISRIAILTLLVSACDYGIKWEDTPYQVIWIDSKNNRTLVYNLGDGSAVERVGAEVIAVGSNKKYVVAKQKNITNKKITYFYIERNKDNKYKSHDEITQGPFSFEKFIELKEKLGLPNFTKAF